MKKIKALSNALLVIVALCFISACGGVMSNTVDIRKFIDQAPQVDFLNIVYSEKDVNKWKASACFKSSDLCVFSEGNDEQDLFKNLKLKAKEATGE